jgi:hypothetical protein
MDVVADGRTAREEAQGQLEADNLGELGQPQDRNLRREPALDPASRRSGDPGRCAGPVEAEIPVLASNADFPARRTNGGVCALIGAVKDALDRCHAPIVGDVTYLRLNGGSPGRAGCRRRLVPGAASCPAPPRARRRLVSGAASCQAPPLARRPRAPAGRDCVQLNTAQAVRFALPVLAGPAQEGCRPVSPAGS